MKRTLISVSTHPAKEKILNFVKNFENANVDFIHCDFMDGNFVEDKAFSIELLSKLKQNTTLPLDCHLMVKNAFDCVKDCCKIGVNFITVHKEVFDNNKQLLKVLNFISKQKILCGVSINPQTEIEEIVEVLPYVDLVLVMSVVAGKSGQSYMQEVNSKIAKLNEIRTQKNYNYLIEVDGGINEKTCHFAVENGADILVSGSYIYNSKNYIDAVESLRVNK